MRLCERIRSLKEIDKKIRNTLRRFGLGFCPYTLSFRFRPREKSNGGECRRDDHANSRRGRDNSKPTLATLMLTLLQRVEPNTNHAGNDLELGVRFAVLTLAHICSDGLRTNVA